MTLCSFGVVRMMGRGQMTPSKSKSKKRTRNSRPSPTERLARKVAQGPLHPTGVVIEPAGQVKMSEVLEQFVEPFLEFARTAEEHRKLFTLAALAWNVALLPPGDGEKMIAEVLNASLAAAGEQVTAEARDIVDMLVVRKRLLFANNTRQIVNIEITKTAHGFHLAVASTL